MKTYRFKITSSMCDNISYVTIGDAGVQHFNASEIPLSLSYISPNAAELRFALEDAASHAYDRSKSGTSSVASRMALDAIKRICGPRIKSVEAL